MAVGGHVSSSPVVVADNPVWALSHARADAARKLLESGGTKATRISRVTGFADRKLSARNPMSAYNNRIEITLLRKEVK